MKVDKDKIIKIIDFWHQSLDKCMLLNRDVFKEINSNDKEIKDIIGPRRSGKSSLLKLIIKSLKKTDGFLYVNFEDPFFIESNNAEIIEEIISVYKEYFDDKSSQNLKYLFFDEIQEIKNWEKAIRKLRDGTDYKIFITGSSSTLLSRELSSLLTGRHLTTKMFPLSFLEFISFKKIKVNSKKDIILQETKIKKKFDDFMEIGGFPEVVITQNKELLKDYFYDFLQKDIIVRYDVRDKEALEKMTVFLMTNSTKIISIASLQKAFHLSFESANNYLKYLKEAFLFFELRQFSYSLKTQNKSLSKIYAVDTGLAQVISFSFSKNNGRILENIIFLHLLRNFSEVFYYKTKNNLEVDFLIRENGENNALIQVSWSLKDEKTKQREVKALFEGMKELDFQDGLIITCDEEDEFQLNNKTIKVVPAWKWLLEN